MTSDSDQPASPSSTSPHVVGLGASAGGLEALQSFFDAAPPGLGLAFVVVQHLSPDHKSFMGELLARHTSMPVHAIEDGIPVERDNVYVLPPRKNVIIANGRLHLADKPAVHSGTNLPIDGFFASLAEDRGDHAIAVILSGTGSDGVRGIRAIKEAGGLVLVQDESSAKFDGMPRSAIATGIVDYVLPPEAMPQVLRDYTRYVAASRAHGAAIAGGDAESLAKVLAHLKQQTGVDFSLYKPATVRRRIERRMGVNQIGTLADYASFVESTRREVATLCKDLLIGVTKFFRDGEAFEVLRTRVIPELVERTDPHDAIRVWVPGCATGEEAYSIAMLFAEHLERAPRPLEVKIFATDIDKDAIAFAGAGVYPESIVADLSCERLARFFTRKNDTFHVARSLRQMVLFAHHNLFKDPPFTRLDVVTCRNLLIYVEPVLQRRTIATFHYALEPERYLMLGPSESLGEMSEPFRTIDSKWKVFQSTGMMLPPSRESAPRTLGTTRASIERTFVAGARGRPTDESLAIERVCEEVTREFLPACLLVDESLELLHVLGDARPFLNVPSGAVTLQVVHMLPKQLVGVITAAVQKALRSGSELNYADLPAELANGQGQKHVHVRVRPISNPRSDRRFASILLTIAETRPVPELHLEAADLDGRRIAELQQELLYAQENLQATIEELQTSNEELQSTNEELLSANEELQSTNEELQSLNEELYTVNAEHQSKIEALVQMTNDMDNLLLSTHIGTLFLDAELQIRKFTPAVTRQIHVLSRDVGRPIQHMALEIPSEGFVEDLQRVLATSAPIQRPVTTRDGGHFLLRILPYVTRDSGSASGVVVTFVDVSDVRLADQRLQSVLDSLAEHVAVLDARGTVLFVNDAWQRFARENGGPAPYAGVGSSYLVTYAASANEPHAGALAIAEGVSKVLAGTLRHFEHEYPCDTPSRRRWFLVSVTRLRGDSGGAVVSHRDITERVLHELGDGTRGA